VVSQSERGRHAFKTTQKGRKEAGVSEGLMVVTGRQGKLGSIEKKGGLKAVDRKTWVRGGGGRANMVYNK